MILVGCSLFWGTAGAFVFIASPNTGSYIVWFWLVVCWLLCVPTFLVVLFADDVVQYIRRRNRRALNEIERTVTPGVSARPAPCRPDSEVAMSQCSPGTTASMVLALSLLTPAPILAATPDDAYLTGYAAAVLAREFELPAPSLRVQGGAVTVTESDLTGLIGSV